MSQEKTKYLVWSVVWRDGCKPYLLSITGGNQSFTTKDGLLWWLCGTHYLYVRKDTVIKMGWNKEGDQLPTHVGRVISSTLYL